MRIVVVGAGVAGCIMARTLARLPGAEVTCLERVAQGDHAESGTGLNIGPNAVLAFRREGYTRSSFRGRDVLQMLGYRGFWRMAAKYYDMGIAEMYRSFSKRAFLKALQRLIPELKSADIHPAGAGVRAQAVDPDGKTVDDFRIVEAERMVHVLNAPSPAATASISIGRTVAGMAAKNFDLPVRPERMCA